MIKNIIFDIGGVLAGFDWPLYLHGLFQDAAVEEAVDAAIWKSNLWNELNRNVIPEEEIFERMRDYDYKHRREIITALTNLNKCILPVDYSIPWLKELKNKGYNLYYLSNYSPLLQRASKEALEFILYTDGGVMSCDIHLIKPDKAIYSAICHIYKLEPTETIFLDNNRANVQAAIDYGMQGLVFENFAQAHTDLQAVLEQYSE